MIVVALAQSSFTGGGKGSVTQILKLHLAAVVVTAVVVDITLTRYTLPTVNADPGVRLNEVTLVLLIQPAEFEFNVATVIVLIIAVLVELVLKICNPGVSSILAPPLVAMLLNAIVGNVDCATK